MFFNHRNNKFLVTVEASGLRHTKEPDVAGQRESPQCSFYFSSFVVLLGLKKYFLA